MKTFVIFFTVIIVFVSCDNSNTNLNFKTKIDISFKDEIYKSIFIDSSGYYAARNLEGIGNFKLGKTTLSIINDLELSLKTKVNKVYNNTDEYSFIIDTKILQLLPNPNQKYVFENPSKYSFCPDVKIFKIKKITISGIEIENLFLTFYKDTLVELKCDENDNIYKALEYKYGKPNVINETFDYICGAGKKEGNSQIILWHNEMIKAEINKSHINCVEDDFDYYFKISTKHNIYDLYISCDSISKRKYFQKSKQEEKAKMKNF